MKRLIFPFLLLSCLLLPAVVRAQVADAAVCDILANPASFDGKIVRIKGVAVAGFEEFAIQGTDCHQSVNAIWLSYPDGTNGKAGPAISLRVQLAKNNPAPASAVDRVPVKLDKNKDFKEFDKLLSTTAKVDGLCLGCVKFTVHATFIGRLDGVRVAGFTRDSSGKVIGLGGFGNLNRYAARLVLQSVSEIAAQEINYAAPAPAVDPKAAANGSYQPEPPTTEQIKGAAAAFGAAGESNGVSVGFGVSNEAPKVETGKSNSDSPDGLCFAFTVDSDRLKEVAMQIVMAHAGAHIADLRAATWPSTFVSNYGLEFRAWQNTLVTVLAMKTKSLMLPGSFVLYNPNWPKADLGNNLYGSLMAYIANWSNIPNQPKP